MGILIADGTIPVVSANAAVADDAESVAAFFSETCAGKNGPTNIVAGTGTTWSGICTACKVRNLNRNPAFDCIFIGLRHGKQD